MKLDFQGFCFSIYCCVTNYLKTQEAYNNPSPQILGIGCALLGDSSLPGCHLHNCMQLGLSVLPRCGVSALFCLSLHPCGLVSPAILPEFCDMTSVSPEKKAVRTGPVPGCFCCNELPKASERPAAQNCGGPRAVS